MKFESQLQIVTAAGVPPVTVNQTALVINFNADLLDGQHGSYYAAASSLGNYLPLTGGTLTGTLTGTIGIFTTVRTTEITSLLGSNGPITITPDGTGHVHINSTDIRLGPNNTNATLATRGTGDLILRTHEGSAVEGFIRIYDGANGNIEITPNGTGTVVVGKLSGSTASFSGVVTSTVATGTAPLVVASTTAVTNLNADLLDGQHGSFYQNAGNLNAGTVPLARLSGSYNIDITGSSAFIFVNDTRSSVTGPQTGYRQVRADFLANSTDGLSDGGIYHGVLTFQQWADASGGGTRQLAFTDNDNLWIRGSGTGLTAYNAWKLMLNSVNYSSYALPLTGGTLTGNLNLSAATLMNMGQQARIQFSYSNLQTVDSGSDRAGWLWNSYYDWSGTPSYKFWSTNAQGAAMLHMGPTQLTFYTKAGPSTANTAFSWDAANVVVHSGNVSTYALPSSGGSLSGSLSVSGNITITSGGSQFRASDGTAAAPGYSFNADTDTGIRRTSDNSIAIVTGGVDRLTFGSTGTATFSGQIASSVATGTAPLSITSTTLVSNLNADLLDGQHASYFENLGITAVGFSGGTLTLTRAAGNLTASLDGRYLQLAGGTLTGNVTSTSGMTQWSPTTPGSGVGNIHIGTTSAVASTGGAITFGARDTGSGLNAQAGIYVVSDGSYGTKMFLATTDSYAAGSKVAISIDHSGNVDISRGALRQGGNQVLHAGNVSTYALPIAGGTITSNLAVSGTLTVTGITYANGGLQTTTGQFTGPLLVNNDNGVRASYDNGGSFAWLYGYGVEFGRATSYARPNTNRSATLFVGGPSINTYDWLNIDFYSSGRFTINNNAILHAGNYNSYALPLTGGALTGTISIDTTGSTALTSSVIIKRSGQSAFNFGQYTGSWRAALQIQSNASDRLLFLAPPESDYQFGILRSANGGLKIDVGGTTANTGNNAVTIDTAGTANFPVGLQQGGNAVLTSATTSAPNLSIGGNAATATRLTNLTSTTTSSAGTDNSESCISYINGISLFGQSDGALYSHVYSASWKHNIYGDYRTGQLAVRGKNNGTWTAWRQVLDSSNYASYLLASDVGKRNPIPETSSTAQYVYLGRWVTVQGGHKLRMRVTAGEGYNANTGQNQMTELYFKTSNGSSSITGSTGVYYADGIAFRIGPNPNAPSLFRVVQVDSVTYDIYGYFSTFTGGGSFYEVVISTGTWTHSGTLATPSGNFIDITPSAILHAGNYNSYALPLTGGTLSGALTFSAGSGTYISTGGGADAFGYNSTAGYGHYIKGTGNTYIYGGGVFFDGSAHRTLLHSASTSAPSLSIGGSAASLSSGNNKVQVGTRGSWEAWQFLSNTASTSALGLYGSSGTWLGMLYSEATNIGFLDSSNSWDLRKNINGELHITVSGTARVALHAGNFSSYTLPLSGGSLTGKLSINSTGAWNDAQALLTVGSGGDGRIQVRHIWGKSAANNNADHLWLNYQNTNGHVQIGDSGGGNNLYVSGQLYAGGYFGGSLVLHAGNYTSYAPNINGGSTIAGITYFSNGESMQVYGIRGRFTNEYLHLYNKVGVGHPGGWGQGEGNTPDKGLSTYGGINVAYGNNATSSFAGQLNANGGLSLGGPLYYSLYTRRQISLAGPSTANFGNWKQFIRLWAASGSGANLFTLKVSVRGSWNWTPVFGTVEAYYSLHLPGDGTINTLRDFRLTHISGPAADNVRLGDAVIENGYISIPVWGANTNALEATVEQWNGSQILGSTTTAVSETLPAFIAPNFRGGLTSDGNAVLHAATTSAPNLSIGGNAATATNASQLGGNAAANFVQGAGSRGRSTGRSSGTANSLTDPSGFYYGVTVTGMPTTDWWHWIQSIGNDWSAPDGYGYQLACSYWSDDLRLRRLTSGTWGSWVQLLHSGNYSGYALPLSGGTLTGALSGTSASFSGALSSGGNSVLTVGNYSSYAVDNTKRVKQFFWDTLSASAAQARRFEIARIAIDIVNWNQVGTFEIELSEQYWSNGLKKKYVVSYGYNSPRAVLKLVEMSGAGTNNFQVVLGSEQPVSGNHYYLPVYVDVRYYTYVDVRVTTSRQITANSTPPVGYTYINASPTPTNITDFGADSTVDISNAATAWQVGGNTIIHSGNYTSYPPARWATGRSISLTGDVTGTSGLFDGTANLSFAATLANSGVTAGTYNNVTVNAKGIVTGGSNVSYLTGNQSISITGDATGSGSTAITLTLANSGVTAGTYRSVTVDAKGRVTAGTNPTTLSGYGITDIAYGSTGSRNVWTITDWNQTTYGNAHFLSSENSHTNGPSSDFIYGLQTAFHRSGAAYRTQMVTELYSSPVSIWVRNSRDSDVWTSWSKLLHSNNYNSYVLSASGTAASLSIGGSAAQLNGQAASYYENRDTTAVGFSGGTLTLTRAAGNLSVSLDGRYLTGNQTITLGGDLSGSGTTSISATIGANAVTTTKINNSAVTYAKIQNVGAASVLGNPSASVSQAPQEITFANLGPYINGVARAWVTFNENPSTGAITINASFGISSVTRLAAGVYQVNFSTAFSDTHYAVSGTIGYESISAYTNGGYLGLTRTANPKTTTSCEVAALYGGTNYNARYIHVVFHR